MTTRTFQLITPLGPDVLKFHRMHGREELARLGEFEIDALSEREDLDPDQVLGSKISVRIELPTGGYRYLSGHATRFAQVGYQRRLHLYRLTMRPWLWLLTRNANCRIFQKMKVPEILKKVFDAHGDVASTSFELSGEYRQWDYCVQYRESDFNFVSRLMEHEGIYYYFRHEAGRHVLVLTDAMGGHRPYAGFEHIPYLPHEHAARAETEHIGEWSFGREIQPGRYVHDNYDPGKPRVQLQGMAAMARAHAHADYEVYDYPDNHLTPEEAHDYAQVRIEELQARHETVQGQANVRGLCVGHLFKLTGQPRLDQNREYLVLSADYRLEGEEYESAEGEGVRYDCSFTALPSRQPFRPERLTRKPVVQGPQTALVVGPAGEEIHTDEQGRVKVRFHWDRYSSGDENSSCWIRVSHPWAGKGWGAVSIPRIGQEVVVEFLEGDPDCPLITGRVYNAELMPPYAAPGMVSGLKSQTHKGAGFNEVSMDDTAGKENMNLHAQYNMGTTVLHDQTNTVQNDQTNTVKNNRTTTVQVGNDALSVLAGARSVTVKGDSSHTVQSGSRTVSVLTGNYLAVAAQAVSLHGKGKGVSVIGDVAGVNLTGNAQGVMITGNDMGATIVGNAKGVKLTGNGEGVSITGNQMGVMITGNQGGVTVNGKEKGVKVFGTSEGVYIDGKGGGGVAVFGDPGSELSGTEQARVFAKTVNVGNESTGEATVFGKKVVLTTGGGASITLDGGEIILQGTIAHIN
ncbi:type VI secretion system Vgr family protein [Caldimonas brevitalea]|uniref:Uncharacterized protein n=1 Tax=Caldimonas brevitalea TaxID=413882 RepID=A0A0G3BWK0_9BURK|nr:type VI secretion system tip protein VgrG [Caldimonas brevitalea]AKJ30915.1 hypothetical protein AAW51_4224 [Caldimonas brevitalea]